MFVSAWSTSQKPQEPSLTLVKEQVLVQAVLVQLLKLQGWQWHFQTHFCSQLQERGKCERGNSRTVFVFNKFWGLALLLVGVFIINFATKLIADVSQSYLNEMLLTVYEYDVVASLKILPEKNSKLGLYNFSWVTQRVKISKQSWTSICASLVWVFFSTNSSTLFHFSHSLGPMTLIRCEKSHLNHPTPHKKTPNKIKKCKLSRMLFI